MQEKSQQFWAIIVAVMGCILGLVGYIMPGTDTTHQYIFQLANSLVSGALGIFVGHNLENKGSNNLSKNTTINQPVVNTDKGAVEELAGITKP